MFLLFFLIFLYHNTAFSIMSGKIQELVINHTLYNTKFEEDRSFIGQHYEDKLFEYFTSQNIDVKHMSKDNKFSLYDYVIKIGNTTYLVELKSRLMGIKNHSVELLCSNKVNSILEIIKKQKNETKLMYIFCHISSENDYEYYYYIVDNLSTLNEICFLNMEYKKWTFELSVKFLKPLDSFL